MARSESRLPVHVGSGMSGFASRTLGKATRMEETTGLAVLRHTLQADAMAQMEMADSEAAESAAGFALKGEIKLLKDGLEEADGMVSAVELVARKTNLLSDANNQRFVRRFGG